MQNKILAVGDIQICPKSYDQIDKFLNEYLLDYITKNDIDTVIFPGDLFEYSNYTNNYVSSASIIKPYSKFFDSLSWVNPKHLNNFGKKVTVIIVDGNHDKSYGSFANANDIFIAEHIIHSSKTIELYKPPSLTCGFILVPWLMPHEYTSRSEVLDYIKFLAFQCKSEGLIPILVGHLRVVDLESSIKIKKSDYSFTFSSEELNSLGIEYGILGDIHTKQNVVNKIDYIGCIRQRNFGEVNNPSVFRVITITNQVITHDKYEVCNFFPEYHTLTVESEEALEKLLEDNHFIDRDFYRIDALFPTVTKSFRPNVIVRSTVKLATKELSTPTRVQDLDASNLIKIYNDYTKEFDDLEKIMKYWNDTNDTTS